MMRRAYPTMLFTPKTGSSGSPELVTAVASTLPIASIVILYSIRSTLTRLAVVALFTAVLFVLTLFTSGKPIEIFSETSA